MPMIYDFIAITETDVPQATHPIFQHLVDTYASESNKAITVWRSFTPKDLPFRPHPRSSSVEEVMKHQLLSERRFFGEFLGMPEPSPDKLLPALPSPETYANRMVELALPRLEFFAMQTESWWQERAPFFDVERERIWIFWRRILHTAHHRTQLTVYLRLLNKAVPATYGPTADVTWEGADPTVTQEAAGRH